MIERLLSSDAPALASAYPGLAARQQACDPSCQDLAVSTAAWTSRLAGAKRSLYAVFEGGPTDVEILIAVDAGGAAAEAWAFKVVGRSLAEIGIELPFSGGRGAPFFHVAAGRAPSPAREYERFYVLPPSSELPAAPLVRALAARTGRSGVDALLATLESRDPSRLSAAFADPAATFVRECEGAGSQKDAAYAASWSRDTAAQLYGVHSVALLPEGYQPRSDHLVIVYRQLKPYWWEAMGILERAGTMAGLITGEWACRPERIYPPVRYVVPPPEGGTAGIDPARRSGVAIVDAIIETAARRDEAAMDRLIEYTAVACGDPIGFPPHTGPPPCPSGVAPGTPVDILPEVVCAGNKISRATAPMHVIEQIALSLPSGLYAVTRPSPTGDLHVVVASRGDAVALTVGERGVKGIARGCGPRHPDALIGGATPTFVLSPP